MLKLFKKFNKKDISIIILVAIIITFSTFLELKIPEYMSEITKNIQTSNENFQNIITPGVLMLLCAIGSLLCTCISGYLTAFLASNFSKKIRRELFSKVESFSVAEVKKFSTSSLITRTTNDITQLEMFLSMGLHLIIKSPVMAIWALLKIINTNFTLSMITGIGVIIIVLTNFLIFKTVIPRFEKIQKLIDRINGVTLENLTGIRVVRAFNAEKYQGGRFNKINNELTTNQLKNQQTFAILNPLMHFIMQFQNLGIYFIGSFLIINLNFIQRIDLFSDMVVFSSYGMQVIISFLLLSIIFMILPRAEVSAKRINEVLLTESSIKDGNLKEKSKEVGTIEFKNVSFKYPDSSEYLLKNISFKIEKGETVAFIGSTGSGKSSLINLIPRLYDTTDGEVLVDGINVKNYEQNILHDKIGYISQKPIIFTGSVSDNVTYGSKNKKQTDIKEAIEVSQTKEFVEKLENKYEGFIARSGTNISGGQKQRLSIARAIFKKPEIYIFDDALSALDYQTDLKLRKALKKHTKDATTVIVAQRIGTIINASKIIVLDKGKCVGIGTHEELLKTCKVYLEIAKTQLSEEELTNA